MFRKGGSGCCGISYFKVLSRTCGIQTMQTRKLSKLLVLLISLCLVFALFLMVRNTTISVTDREQRLKKIDELIHTQDSSLACKQPKLPVYSPEIMRFVHSVAPVDCSKAGMDWVKCQGSECAIQDVVKTTYGPIKCSFTDVIRVTDFVNTDGSTTYTDSSYKLETSDTVRVSCKSASDKWAATLTGIHVSKDIFERTGWDYLPANALKFNVLILGFDSLSRNSFIRKLPKSYKYLTETLKGDVLEGYNIVGDGTPQALIPLLTGKTELELPDTRKRFSKTKYVNSYPFIWNDFKSAGYATAFFEDVPELSTFTYRLNGFKEMPTDHYMRPYYIASAMEKSKWPKLCTGDTPRHKIMLNQIKNFFSVYKSKPKFLFAFHGEMSHDSYNLIGAADDDLEEFLQELRYSGVLNNTIFILMADHGHRFADIRNTVQGKQEERLPFFSFTFPTAFKIHFFEAYENFRSNLDKLSTPFDVYSTLKDVLDLKNVGMADITQRSVSLFSKIPQERSCAHAYIEPHWCACLQWEKVPLSSPIVNRVAEKLLSALNNYTESHRDICQDLKISKIIWVTKMVPSSNLLKFNKNADVDGFVADMSANLKLKSEIYQINLETMPGRGLFEASVSHTLESNTLDVKITDISRINIYGRQARCVEQMFPHLRKYCYCRSDD